MVTKKSKELVFDGGLKPNSNCYLGIDQSLTGFAVTLLHESSDAYMTYVYTAEGTGIVRLFNITSWLHDILYSYVIVDSAIEAPVKMSHSAIISGELFGVARMALYEHLNEPACFPLQVPPTLLKKYVAGKGQRVQKSQMLLQTHLKWGVIFSDDNAADSYGLAHMVKGDYKHKYEETILNQLKDPKFRDTDN